MIRLSDRLQHLADFVPEGSSLADIGTDHGKLPVYLLQKGICDRVVLSDVGSGPLERALDTIKAQMPPGSFQLRLGDGLSTLGEGEVDVVVIAGMGGSLIAAILDQDRIKTASFSRFILQPRNGKDKLRRYLLTHGMRILEEDLVREGKYFCEIIVAAPSPLDGSLREEPTVQEPDTELALEVSPLLFLQPHPLLIPFLKKKIEVERGILDKIRTGKVTKGRALPLSSEVENRSLQRIEGLEALLNKAENR